MPNRLSLANVSARLGGPVLKVAMPRPRGFWIGIAFGALSAACAVGLLATSAYLIAAAALQPPIMYLQMAIVGVRAFALGRAFFRYLERIASHEAAFRMLGRLRTAVFSALIPGAPANLQRHSRGDTVSRLVADVDELQNLSLRVWQPILTAGSISILSVIGVALVSVPAAVVLLVCLVIAAVGGALLPAWLAARSAASVAAARGRQFALTTQYLNNVDVLTAFEAVDAERGRLRQADDELFRYSTRVVWGDGLSSAVLVLVTGIAVIGTFLVSAPIVTAGDLAGPFMAMIVLVPMSVFEVFDTTPKAVLAFLKVRASAARIDDLAPGAADVVDESADESDADIAAEAKAEGDDTAAPIHPQFTSLTVRNASFGWDRERPAVRDLGFELKPGKRILITGASGTGKSTIAWGLVRFLPLLSGAIAINGEDAVSWDDEAVRRVIGLCEQQPHVFASTVRANLHLADPSAGDEQMMAVLERVGLADVLAEREGLDTLVGESGALLSGGEIQRLALARALLGGFPVIVFDEPTANVDPELRVALMQELLAATAVGENSPAVIMMSHDEVPGSLIDEHISLD